MVTCVHQSVAMNALQASQRDGPWSMGSFALVWEQSGDWLSRTYISINSVSHKYFFGVEPTNKPLR